MQYHCIILLTKNLGQNTPFSIKKVLNGNMWETTCFFLINNCKFSNISVIRANTCDRCCTMCPLSLMICLQFNGTNNTQTKRDLIIGMVCNDITPFTASFTTWAGKITQYNEFTKITLPSFLERIP